MLRPGTTNYNSSMRLTVTWEDEDGAAFDPSTVMFYTISPDGTENSYTYSIDSAIQRAAEGQYTVDFTANKTGKWHFRWYATDDATHLYREGKFYVQHSPWYDATDRAYGR